MTETIQSVRAREILDSRGNPTVEVEVTLRNGVMARAASPSGASTGKLEAFELRDNDPRYGGKGVQKAVRTVNGEIARLLVGKDVEDQNGIDTTMILADGTKNKQRLGGNATIAVSIAVARAAATANEEPVWQYLGGPDAGILPVPMMNIMNGGVHANWQGPDFQEYMIAPCGAANFGESLRWGAETYHALKALLKKKGFATAVGDEGGFVVKVSSNEAPLELMVKAIEEAGYRPGKDIGIALDPASSAFFEDGHYRLRSEGVSYKNEKDRLLASGKSLTSDEMIDRYASLLEAYPIISIEDGLAEDDWEGWKHLNQRLGGKVELVGDDIFVTNTGLIEQGIRDRIANSVLIKPNQIGTVSETISAVRTAQAAGWGVEVSHRSGETVDTFIADLAVAIGSGKMKTGAPARGERVEKYNQLLRIEEALGDKARFLGKKTFERPSP